MYPQIAIILFTATLVQGVAGFGLALISMPLLVSLVGIQMAAPLVALIGLTSVTLIAWHHRADCVWSAIKPLAIGSLIGVPLGVIALEQVDENLVTLLLGLVVGGYAIYVIIAPRFSLSDRPRWGYGFGLMGGILTGAYNTGGPPLVMYGDGRHWPPTTFKANVQVLLMIHSGSVLLSHLASHNFTSDVVNTLPIALAACFGGTLTGLILARYVSPIVFRSVVLLMLLVLGVQLVATSLGALLSQSP